MSSSRTLFTSLFVSLLLAGTAGATTLDATLGTHTYAPIGHQTWVNLVINTDGYYVPVTFTYTTPPGLTYAAQQYLPYSCTAPADGGAGTITCTDYVTPGVDGGYYSLVFNVPPSTSPGTTFPFNVTVTSPHTTPATIQVSASQTAALLPTLDFSTTFPPSVAVGAPFSYDLTVHNSGPGTAQDLHLSLRSSTSRAPIISGTAPCSVSAPVTSVLCSLPDLPEGATTTLHFTSTSSPDIYPADPSAQIVMEAAVGESSNSFIADYQRGIDLTRISDLKVTAMAPPQVNMGSDFTYTANVTNSGPSTARYFQFTFPIPSGTTFKAVSASSAYCTPPPVGGTGSVTCYVDSLNPASIFTTAGTWTMTVTLHAAIPGVSVSNGVVNFTGDPDLSNNTGSVTTEIVGPTADIAVGLTADAATTASGDAAATVTVHNNGPDGATNVSANVMAPSAAAVSQLPAGCTASGTTVTCTQATLAAGATAAFPFDVNYLYAGPQTITATASSDAWDPNTANNNASAGTSVQPTVDLFAYADAISLSSVTPGQTSLLMVDVGNRGSASAQTTTRITIPSGFTASPRQGCTLSGLSVVQCTATLPAHTTQAFQLYLTAPQTPGIYSVPFAITSDGNELNPADNTGQQTVTVFSDQVDIRIDPERITASPAQVIAFTVRIMNSGQVTQDTLHVSDTLPAGMTLLSVTPTLGSCAPGPVIDCAIGTLVPGASMTLTVNALAPLSGIVVNQVNLAVNHGVHGVTMEITVIAPHRQLDAAVDPVSLTASPGQLVTFTIRVANGGNVAQDGITIADALPPAMSVVSATPSSGTCAATGNTINCSAGTLQPGTAMSVFVSALAPLFGSVTNQVQATSLTDAASASTTINVIAPPPRQLGVTIDPGSIAAVPAQVIQFTIHVTNGGQTAQNSVAITDALPPAMSLLSMTPSAGTCATNGNALTCSAATLAPGGSMTIAVSAIAPLSAAATNSVQVTSATDTAAATMSITLLPTSRHHAARH